ncbi:MAG: hypothetical protein RIQ70_861 [Bacteroidota bacterium]
MILFDNFVRNITGFFETKIELLKLDIQERISTSLSGVVHLILMVLVIFLVVLFAGISLGFGLGDLLDNNSLGFLMVSILFGVLLFIMYKKIFVGIINKEIEKSIDYLFKNKKDGDK